MSEEIKSKELDNLTFPDQLGEPTKNIKDDNHEEVDTFGKKSLSGWYDIEHSKLPYEGLLYDKKYKYQVKPITTGTIKDYSAMDEKNPLSVASALDNVIISHIRVLDGSKQIPVQNVIHENDRFFFTMLVHAYSGAPTSLSFEHACEGAKCSNKQDVNITPFNLVYTELSEKGMSWVIDKGYFEINTASFGKLKYKPLSLSESAEITQFIIDKKQKEKVDIERQFLEFAPLLVHTMPEGTEVKHTYQKYLEHTADQKRLSLYNRIAELCEHKLTMEVSGECTKCKRPFRTAISSLAGLRSIFFVHDIDNEFS